MTSIEEQQKKTKQQEIDSILDAALDELDEDSDDNSDDDGNERVKNIPLDQNNIENEDGSSSSSPPTTAASETPNAYSMGVPYSLEYLESNPRKSDEKQSIINNENDNRPKFGPEPPPPPPPDHGLSTEEVNLAASLEGMMKQFASGLDSAEIDFNDENDLAGNMAELENAEKALEEMFTKMMMGDGGMPVPSSPSANASAAASSQSKKKSSKSSTSKNGNSSNKEANDTTEPNVNESINRLLDGINQASSSTPQPSNNPTIPSNMDPSQLEQLSEQMMGSLMNDFEKLGNSKDSNDVVDGVMKQLLDKELMYTPMKEVCSRYPKWLATNKERLSEEEYQKYGTQYQYFQRIVRLYETEPGNFDRLMELMQDIQEYGQPPVEIIKELAPDLQFDEEGMPVMDPMNGMGMPGMMPGMPFPMGGPNGEQCCIS